MGRAPDTVEPSAIVGMIASVRASRLLPLLGRYPVPFVEREPMLFYRREAMAEHIPTACP